MLTPRAAALVPRLEWVDATGSTNAELVRLASAQDRSAWPAWSVLVTDRQTAGRGRLGRTWTAPPGTALAISVLLAPSAPRQRWGWLPLIAGAAMSGALRSLGADTALKWPNDVLAGERKVCGVLAEALQDGSAVVVGAGVNTRMPETALPVPSATSLGLLGVDASEDDVLTAYLTRLRDLVGRFDAAGGDAEAGGVAGVVRGELATVGRGVRVLLPGGGVEVGRATGLDPDGRLEVACADGRVLQVSAGDVEHLRYE